MTSLKCINNEFYGSSNSSERGTIFPLLEKLFIEDIPNLEEWQGIERDSQQTDPCPSLEEHFLKRCPKLKSLPSEILSFVQGLKIQNNELTSLPDELSNIISLKRLSIFKCPALQFVPVLRSPIVELLHIEKCQSLKSLSLQSIVKLHIESCHSLKSLSQSLQCASTLEELEVYFCDQLELSSHDFQNLISLQYLELIGLPKLTSVTALQHLSKLKDLTIRACQNLMELSPHGMQNLTVLEELTLGDCRQLKLSSTDFQHLIKLQRISLWSMPELRSLPELQHLLSLDSLFIYSCKNLKELPQWLQNLTSLQTLDIRGCGHDLESRCAEDSGEYWPFIKHIPTVIID